LGFAEAAGEAVNGGCVVLLARDCSGLVRAVGTWAFDFRGGEGAAFGDVFAGAAGVFAAGVTAVGF
jgi:hypothetical protein